MMGAPVEKHQKRATYRHGEILFELRPDCTIGESCNDRNSTRDLSTDLIIDVGLPRHDDTGANDVLGDKQ